MTMTPGPAEPGARTGAHLRLRRIAFGALTVVVGGALAQLLGWDIAGWFTQLWDAITGISAVYVIAGCTAGFVQTTSTAFGWWAILRYGFPDGEVPWRRIWAVYAASVALNGILPAHRGTRNDAADVHDLISRATVAGAFDIKFGFIKNHPWATLILLVGGGVTSVTPGGVGMTQAFKVASLQESRRARTRRPTRSPSS